jgi:glycosyltransferase involved in cell wall biosynthesis
VGDDLHFQLDFPLPDELAVGLGTALFLGGWCFSAQAPVRSLAFVVGGEVQPVLACGAQRVDVARAHDGSFTGSERSGFWGVARVGPESVVGSCELLLRAALEGGGEAVAKLAQIPIVEPRAPTSLATPELPTGPQVAICMASYDPPPDLLARQLESIRAQSHRNWICIISDDCSTPRLFDGLLDAVAGDPRFVVSRSPRRLGFYRNFERALSMVPEEASFVAMADQDDRWHPNKLETLIDEIGDAQLIYSDARIVTREGATISDTYWSARRNNYTDLLSLLVANSVTGAASLFRSELLDYALPFPPAQFLEYHDHWVALTALALGEITFTARPLYDYVQHDSAILGHAAANRMTALADRLGSLRRDPRERVRLWRRHYFVDVCRLIAVGTVLRMRCGEQMSPTKRLALDRFLNTDRSPASMARLGFRGARELVGPTETLGAEWMLVHAFGWRWIQRLTTHGWVPRRARVGARPPARLVPREELAGLEGTGPGEVAEKFAPLDLAVSDDAPERVNILVPTIDLRHFFGGYIAKFNLARRLAERGVRVRVVTVDPVGPLPRSWPRRLESYSGLAGVLDRIEIGFGRESAGLEISRADRFIATTWWTAYIADSALRSLDRHRFLYLIQEYEPFTFPMGSYAALAQESYALDHVALFSTELLREYFRRHGIGVYAGGEVAGDAKSAAFENAITAVDPPTAAELTARRPRRLLFYSRPEPHASRNMFELAVLALRRAVEQGAFRGAWSLDGIGTLDAGRPIALGDGTNLRLLPRSRQRAYAEVLRDHDVGLALMYTPHPSLVPIEMASAGMLTVTNSFENKTPERMAEISPNLITVPPTVEAIAGGLARAAGAVEDLDRRIQGSHVNWSRDWNRSFDDALLARVISFLEL